MRRAVRQAGKGFAGRAAAVGLVLAGTISCGPAWSQEGEVEQTPASVARGEVQDAMERLESEIAMLKKLRGAQESLQKWNDVRAQMGVPPAALDRELCGLVGEWCGALPATFGLKRRGRAGE